MKRISSLIIVLVIIFGLTVTSYVTASTILLNDNFNSENGGVAPDTMYYNFQNWIVTSGSVDLCGPAFYSYHHMPSSVGLYVDLDGSSSAGGILVSKTDFVLTPGLYELKFDLSGSRDLGQNPNLVNVSLGSVYSEGFTIGNTDAFDSFAFVMYQR